MCEPITASLIVGGTMAGGATLAGASTMAAVGAGALGAMTTYSGMESANASMEAGYAQGAAYYQSSEEMMKQIEAIETNAEIEENNRRAEFMYFTSENLAAAASTGASIDSASFEAIRKNNERNFAEDETIAAVNVNNQKRQLALQSAEYSRAGDAAIKSGRQQRRIGLLNTGVSLLQNAVTFGMPTFGDNTAGLTSSLRPRARPARMIS